MNIVKVDIVGEAAAAKAAADMLLRGGVAVFPTDTVYGLACHPDFPEALARVCAIKGRDPSKPIAFLASDAAAPGARGAVLSERATALTSRYWPGALTIVADCCGVNEGFRVPDCALARRIIALCGGLLRVTSANPSGMDAATSADDPSMLAIAGKCDIIIDGGPCDGGVASTVIQDEPWRIIREGAIPAAEL